MWGVVWVCGWGRGGGYHYPSSSPYPENQLVTGLRLPTHTSLALLSPPPPPPGQPLAQLVVAFALASACIAHHLVHWLGGSAPHWLHHVVGSVPLQATLSALALLGEPAWEAVRGAMCCLASQRLLCMLWEQPLARRKRGRNPPLPSPPFHTRACTRTHGTTCASAHSPPCPPKPAGPGREIVQGGFSCLARGAPDMNSLVGLGAVASFGVSAVAALLPQLRTLGGGGWGWGGGGMHASLFSHLPRFPLPPGPN